MSPYVFLIRHAESLDNVSTSGSQMRDPPLTEKGERQCIELRDVVPMASIGLLVTSPLRRAVDTALNCFKESEVSIHVLDELREILGRPCDVVASARGAEGGARLTYESLGSSHASPKDRCVAVRRWLRSRPERAVALVSHAGVLHLLTDEKIVFAGCLRLPTSCMSLAGKFSRLTFIQTLLANGYKRAESGWRNAGCRCFLVNDDDCATLEEVVLGSAVLASVEGS